MRAIIIALVLISGVGCLGLTGISAAGWYQALSSREALKQAQLELAQARHRVEALEENVDQAQALQAEAQDRANRAEQLIDCGFGDVQIDYSGNAQVSESLQAFVSENYAPVDGADWEEFWIDSEDALHTLVDVGDFSYDFFVYYVQPGTESRNAVFYLTWGCWLDLPADQNSQ